jgi:hypothetical protein
VPKDLHRKASKGDKVCAVFTHHLRTGDKGYLHWGKVLAVEGSECTIKWQTDKKPNSHSIADVFFTEAAAWAAFHSIPSSDIWAWNAVNCEPVVACGSELGWPFYAVRQFAVWHN